jgi:hypothetical protein
MDEFGLVVDDLPMRDLGELIEVDDPAWPVLLEEISRSEVPVEVLPADEAQGRCCLLQLQVTVRSYLGAVAVHSGGLLLDGGWLRMYGSGGASSDVMPGIAHVNGFPAVFEPSWRPVGLVVAHDVLGGVFALNGLDSADAGRPGEPGEVVYFAPDSMEWESLQVGHGGRTPTGLSCCT